MEIHTNWHRRPLLTWWDLSDEEREQVGPDREDVLFFRYRGWVYGLDEFMRDGAPSGWDGALAETYWSGVAVKLALAGEASLDYGVIVGSWYT